jgi:hypothetical protein
MRNLAIRKQHLLLFLKLRSLAYSVRAHRTQAPPKANNEANRGEFGFTQVRLLYMQDLSK